MGKMPSMASMASVEPAMESRWGGVGWGVSMKSMGSLRGGAPHKLAGGGESGGGRAAALPPPGRSYHRFYPYMCAECATPMGRVRQAELGILIEMSACKHV